MGIGAKGSEGVTGNVVQTGGSIGFVEYAYAKQNNLAYTRMMNKAGKVVNPVASAVAAAAATATWDAANGFGTMLTDQPGADAWPISGATWVIFYKNPPDSPSTNAGLKFFQWSYANGDQMASGLDYVPFPNDVKQRIMTSWSQIQGWNGK